jgi:Immunoglobulin I-set domain.
MQELLIKHVGIQDGGVYICRGENKVGVAEAKVTLTVGSRPRIQPNMNGELFKILN